ncbi:unnamed protein product [Musa acuminata subsp. burmannicoides]
MAPHDLLRALLITSVSWSCRELHVCEVDMASSLPITASFLGGVSVADRPSIGRRRSLVVAKAATHVKDTERRDGGENNGRRAVMFAAAAAAVCGIGQGIATADEEPKRGTLEAKKKYAPICVTMPTARICHQ